MLASLSNIFFPLLGSYKLNLILDKMSLIKNNLIFGNKNKTPKVSVRNPGKISITPPILIKNPSNNSSKGNLFSKIFFLNEI